MILRTRSGGSPVQPDDSDGHAVANRRHHPRAAGAIAAGAVALLVVIPACSSTSTPTSASTTTTSPPAATTTTAAPPPVTFQQGSSAEVAACEADAKVVEVALQAYMAQKGVFPSPPSPWSAATYTANFEPLTSASGGGPYMPKAPSTTSYVIEYDSSGDVWVAPPGSYGAVYNPGQSFDANPNICLASVR